MDRAFSFILEEEVRIFHALVEVAVLESSEKSRRMFTMHLCDRYPCVKRLYPRDGIIYADIKNGPLLYAIPVMPVPETYMGETSLPRSVELSHMLQ